VSQYKSEYRIIRPSDGEVRWIRAVGEIERDENAAPIALVGAHIDITDRKLAEHEALESEEEMREACARIRKPMMANMADGGKTPIRSGAELAEIGYALAIFPSITGLASAAASL